MRMPVPENFLVDKKGKPVGVVMSIQAYRRILRRLEELEDIAAYDEAKAAKEEAIPFERALREIERSRK